MKRIGVSSFPFLMTHSNERPQAPLTPVNLNGREFLRHEVHEKPHIVKLQEPGTESYLFLHRERFEELLGSQEKPLE
jgi:hypothetical protein